MIGKKMLAWIGVGLLSAATIPALAVTARHVAAKSHTKLAHGAAKATAGKSKMVAGHLVHAAPVRAQHRVNATHKVNAVHKVHAKNAVHAVHATHKAIGVTSMHSGRTTLVSHKPAVSTAHRATASAHASLTHKTGTTASKSTTVKHVTAKAAPVRAITLSAVAPKKTTHTITHTTAAKASALR